MECQRPFAGEDGYYDPIAVALVCSRCRSGSGCERVSSNALGLIPAFKGTPIEQWLESGEAPPGTRELRCLLEKIIEAHLERKLTTRALLAEEL